MNTIIRIEVSTSTGVDSSHQAASMERVYINYPWLYVPTDFNKEIAEMTEETMLFLCANKPEES